MDPKVKEANERLASALEVLTERLAALHRAQEALSTAVRNDSSNLPTVRTYPVREDLKEVGIEIPYNLFNLSYDKFFVEASLSTPSRWKTGWAGPLGGTQHKAYPYYCPTGWRRFALSVPSKFDNFDVFKDTCTFYHGSHPKTMQKILRNGMIPQQCQHGCKAVYLSPSILYASHPRYAKVVEVSGHYYQAVLEVRVWDKCIEKGEVKPETLSVRGKFQIDPNHPNTRMELVVKGQSSFKPEDGLVPTGVMLRRLDHDPLSLDTSNWWLEWPRGHVEGRVAEMDSVVDREACARQEAGAWLRDKCYFQGP